VKLILIIFVYLSASAGLMGASKSEINLVMSKFKNKEGAFIKSIRRESSGLYSVEIQTKLGKCFEHKIKIKKQNKKTKKALVSPEVKPCV
jgi:hypothetical protein